MHSEVSSWPDNDLQCSENEIAHKSSTSLFMMEFHSISVITFHLLQLASTLKSTQVCCCSIRCESYEVFCCCLVGLLSWCSVKIRMKFNFRSKKQQTFNYTAVCMERGERERGGKWKSSAGGVWKMLNLIIGKCVFDNLLGSRSQQHYSRRKGNGKRTENQRIVISTNKHIRKKTKKDSNHLRRRRAFVSLSNV